MKKVLLFMMLLVSVLLFTSCEVNTQEEKKNNDVEPMEVKEEKKSVDLNSSDPFPGYTREMFNKPEPEDLIGVYNERRWYLKIDDFLTNDYYIIQTITSETGKDVRLCHVGPYLTDEDIELMKGYIHYTNENMDELEQTAKEMMLKFNPNLDHIDFYKTKMLFLYDGEVTPIIKFFPTNTENMRNYIELSFNSITKEEILETKLPKLTVERIEIK